MSVDILQEKIRKTKNPTVLELTPGAVQLPPQYSGDGEGWSAYCLELMQQLHTLIPAVRISFSGFALLGHDGLYRLSQTLIKAAELGYYVLLDAPEILSPTMAERIAQAVFGENSLYPCDGLVISGYPGSDVIKPFLPYCRENKKDLFVVTRTANKSAAELQDLLCGSRLVHVAAADHVNRYGADCVGKTGYSRVGILGAASSAESLRSLRSKYPRVFLLVDGYDYPNANAKNCSFAFDKFGHGAAVCSGTEIAGAWQKAESDGSDWLKQSQAAAERMRKNLTRYVTVL